MIKDSKRGYGHLWHVMAYEFLYFAIALHIIMLFWPNRKQNASICNFSLAQ